MKIPIYQIDAFAEQIFQGNPAAVCLLDEWLPDATLQAIAAENNLAETAFLIADSDANNDIDYALRWFTPTFEIVLCGHATLAAGFVIMNFIQPQLKQVCFSSQSGKLTAKKIGQQYQIDLPIALIKQQQNLADVEKMTGQKVLKYFYAESLKMHLAILPNQQAVENCQPDLSSIKNSLNVGLIVSAEAKDTNIDFVSRFFAPGIGIEEDPVTGSAHCVMMPYWTAVFGKNKLTAKQLSARTGTLLCELDGDRIKLTGSAQCYLQGEIFV